MDQGLEVRIHEEGRLGAIALIAEVELTQLPRLGHHEAMTTALQAKTIALVQVVHVFALEVSTALLTPVEELPLCCLDVGHERGVVCVPGIVSLA